MTTFYRPPAGILLDELAERIAARVVDAYTDVEAELLTQIAYRVIRDLPANPDLNTQLAVIRSLQDTARRLVGRIPTDLAADIVALAAERGAAAAVARMGLTDDMLLAGSITRTVAEAVAMVQVDLGNAFSDVTRRILRYPIDAVGRFIGTDAYQATVARFIPTRLTGALTTDELRRRTLAAFLDQGITGFIDRSRRRWTIGSYTEMATRTATQRAYIDAGVARMGRADARFVSILGNNDACEMCARWFASVLSIDGTPAGRHQVEHAHRDGEMVTVTVAATLDEARASGFMHPNCACELAAYLPGMRLKVAAPRFDPEAAAARDRQRALERRVRALKRRAGIQEATGLDSAPTRARVRATQAEIRELLTQSGQARRYDRESEAWARGPGRRIPDPIPVVPGPPTPGPGTLAATLGVDHGS